MNEAAIPISTTETASPITSTQVCPSAAPATASTLSRLMDRSASTICIIDSGSDFSRREVPAATAAVGRRSSRNIFQHTQSSSTPPASTSPTISSSCRVMAPSRMRSTVAAPMPRMMAGRFCRLGRPATARPTTTALSPASVISTSSTCSSAESSGSVT